MLEQKILDYINDLIPERESLIKEMEEFAHENQVPIMDLIGMEALLQLIRLMKPKKILEIGTAIGYSAIRIAKAAPQAKVITVERDPIRYEQALSFIQRSNLDNRIHVIHGDALIRQHDIQRHKSYDLIFIDAAKGQYKRFFEMYEDFLTDEGSIITDNILFRGLVADNTIGISKRYKKLVEKIQSYNEWLMKHPNYQTVLLPVGDGIAISKKR